MRIKTVFPIVTLKAAGIEVNRESAPEVGVRDEKTNHASTFPMRHAKDNSTNAQKYMRSQRARISAL